MDEIDQQVLDTLARLNRQTFDLKAAHHRLMKIMRRQHQLIAELIEEDRERNQKLDQLIHDCLGDDDSWWKKGTEPPWQS